MEAYGIVTCGLHLGPMHYTTHKMAIGPIMCNLFFKVIAHLCETYMQFIQVSDKLWGFGMVGGSTLDMTVDLVVEFVK